MICRRVNLKYKNCSKIFGAKFHLKFSFVATLFENGFWRCQFIEKKKKKLWIKRESYSSFYLSHYKFVKNQTGVYYNLANTLIISNFVKLKNEGGRRWRESTERNFLRNSLPWLISRVRKWMLTMSIEWTRIANEKRVVRLFSSPSVTL